MTVNNIRPRASHGNGKMCKTNMCPFHRVYKTSTREFKRQGQSILPITNPFAIDRCKSEEGASVSVVKKLLIPGFDLSGISLQGFGVENANGS